MVFSLHGHDRCLDFQTTDWPLQMFTVSTELHTPCFTPSLLGKLFFPSAGCFNQHLLVASTFFILLYASFGLGLALWLWIICHSEDLFYDRSSQTLPQNQINTPRTTKISNFKKQITAIMFYQWGFASEYFGPNYGIYSLSWRRIWHEFGRAFGI